MSDAFHELFEINELGNPVNFPLADTFVKWTAITEGISGPSDLLTFDVANSQIVVGPRGEGTFAIFMSCDFGGSNNTMFTFSIFLNAIRQPKLEFLELVRPPDDRMAGEVFSVLKMVPGDTIDLRFAADKAAKTLIVFRAKLWIIGTIRTP